MNKQFKMVNGVKVNDKIEWTDYTHNPVGGCPHRCRWQMPNGEIAVCYAETTAEGVARGAYPKGFGHHYWRPHKLDEPLGVKTPSRIFVDSMSDLFSAQVPEEHVRAVLEAAGKAHWHQFQALTKNPGRIRKFANDIPSNMWILISSPPDFMFGKPVSDIQKATWTLRAIELLGQLKQARPEIITGMSIEPLSWDIAPILDAGLLRYPLALEWAIIGAASNGHTYYQPDAAILNDTLRVLDENCIRVFYKGNLSHDLVDPWREEWPVRDPIAKATHEQ